MSELTVADELALADLAPEVRALVDRLIAAAIEQRADSEYDAGYRDGADAAWGDGYEEGFAHGTRAERERPRGIRP